MRSFFRREFDIQLSLQAEQRRHAVGRRRAHSSLHRELLLYLDDHLASAPQRLHHAVGHFVAGVGLVQRDVGLFAADLDAGTALQIHPDGVVQGNRLIYSAQHMEAIRTRRADLESEIDLRKRANGRGHGESVAGGSWPVASV